MNNVTDQSNARKIVFDAKVKTDGFVFCLRSKYSFPKSAAWINAFYSFFGIVKVSRRKVGRLAK